MPSFIDYSNKKIGRVSIISLSDIKASKWACKCDCGNEFISRSINFKNGDKFECKKCIFERRRGIDLSGRKYGRWTVINRALDKNNKTVYFCRCDCGNEGFVPPYSLGKKSKSMSCGCLGRKMKSKWANSSLYPKSSKLSTTHFYAVRQLLIHKCYKPSDPSYDNFGAKGITVCELWRNSARDMYEWCISQGWKEKSCILLKRGEKEFSPNSVYFIHYDELKSEIAKHKAQIINYKGESLRISEWSKKLGINKTTLRQRLNNYPSVEEAFETPFVKHNFSKNDELKKECLELFKELKSCTKVAKHFGVTAQTIEYHIKKLTGKNEKWVRKHDIKDEEIQNLLKQGKSRSEIAKIYDTSWTTINERINRMNGIVRKR